MVKPCNIPANRAGHYARARFLLQIMGLMPSSGLSVRGRKRSGP